MEKAYDELTHVSNRSTVAAVAGSVVGSSYAIFRGIPLRQTTIQSFVSSLMIGTACFGFERIVSVAIRGAGGEEPETRTQRLISHGVGGFLGGGTVGFLYQMRPIPGMLLFTPVMLGVAFGEEKYESMREERRLQIQTELDAERKQIQPDDQQ